MLQSKVSTAIRNDSKVLLNFRQGKSVGLLDSADFFNRVCEALDISTGRGAKAEVAKKLALTKTSVGLWADGEMPGRNSLDSLVKISELGNVSLHWLLTGQGQKHISGENRPPEMNLDDFITEKIRAIVREELEKVATNPEENTQFKVVKVDISKLPRAIPAGTPIIEETKEKTPEALELTGAKK